MVSSYSLKVANSDTEIVIQIIVDQSVCRSRFPAIFTEGSYESF